MARQRVAREQDHVDEEERAAEAEPHLALVEHREVDVEPQEEQRDEREVQEVAVDVLEDEREGRLQLVPAMDRRLTDGAAGRIGEVEAVVGLAVVVAGRPEAERDPQDQQAGADPARQPVRPDQRREERREVAVELVRRAEQRREEDPADAQVGGADREDDRLDPRRDPPGVAPRGSPEPQRGRSGRFGRHRPGRGGCRCHVRTSGRSTRRAMIASAKALVPAVPPRS